MKCNHASAYQEILDTIQMDPTSDPIRKYVYVANSFFRFRYKDRHLFLKAYPQIKNIAKKYQQVTSINFGWHWEDKVYNGQTLRNPTPIYEVFVSATTRSGVPGTDDFQDDYINGISDTTDPLYDLSLFELIGITDKIKINCYSRTLYGFEITLFSRAQCFELQNALFYKPRKLHIAKTNPNQYTAKLYMLDKEHLCVEDPKYYLPQKKTVPKKKPAKTIESDGWFCTKCNSQCHVYEQGLSCDCDNPWLTEVYEEKDYPSKWVKCKINITLT